MGGGCAAVADATVPVGDAANPAPAAAAMGAAAAEAVAVETAAAEADAATAVVEERNQTWDCG